MKRIATIVCLILSIGICVRLTAQESDRITASFHEVALAEVLAQLSQQYKLRFSYSEDHVALDKKITLRVDHVGLEVLLQQLARKADVECKLIGDQIVIRRKASSERIVRGKVVDASSGEPLAFASVRIARSAVGTATNNDGVFMLTVPQVQEGGTLVISYIGYRNYTAPLTKGDSVFKLDVNAQELAAVEISAKNGASILQEAIQKISQNYDTGCVRYTYFVRDQSTMDEQPIAASETLYQAYRGGQSAAIIRQQVKVIEGRRVRDFAALQRILQTFIRLTGFDLNYVGNVIFTLDLNIPPSEDLFPSARFMTQHTFELLGVSMLGEREVYVIDFDQKASRRKSLYKGKFYIDTETLAFVRTEVGLSPRGIEHAHLFNAPRVLAALFGFGKCAVKADTRVVNYQQVNGKWYPSTMEEYFRLDLVKPQQTFNAAIEVRSNVIVTAMESGNVTPFREAECLTAGDMKNLQYLYRLPALTQRNAIQTDLDMQTAFETIARSNQRQGIDMNFWRRYQPYSSDPALLVRDSLLSLGQDPAKDSSAGIEGVATESGNNPLKPKYAGLNRTFTTPHFVLHYLSSDSSSAQAVATTLNANYDRVLREFKIAALEGPVTVELYPNTEHYHFAIGNVNAPDSDAGMAVDLNRFMMVSPDNPGRYHTRASLLKGAVHEFAHCVHYQLMDRMQSAALTRVAERAEAPWLFEAMASYAAEQFYPPTQFPYIINKQYPSLRELNNVEANGKVYDLGFVIIEFYQSHVGPGGAAPAASHKRQHPRNAAHRRTIVRNATLSIHRSAMALATLTLRTHTVSMGGAL
jgi:hypothetical protein